MEEPENEDNEAESSNSESESEDNEFENEEAERHTGSKEQHVRQVDEYYKHICDRSITEKYWCLLFVVISITWITTWAFAIYHQRQSDLQIDSQNITLRKNETETINYYFWGKNWMFDMITCNLAFINQHYERSGSIVIWTNLLLSIALFKYSISSMRTTNFYQSLLNKSCIYLVLLTTIFRILMFCVIYFKSNLVINFIVLPSHEKLYIWLIPEVICITIWFTKKCYICEFQCQNHHDEFRRIVYTMMPVVAIILTILITLFVYTMDIVYQLGWNSPLSYVIVIGSCYIGLTIFYLSSIVISCAAIYSFVNLIIMNGLYYQYQGFYRSLLIAARYHFGTACYHATLFPSLHAYFVAVKEFNFKEWTTFSKNIDKFNATYYELNNFRLMFTAIGGEVWLRPLINGFGYCDSTDTEFLPPSLKYFQGFSRIARSLAALLISINNLSLISLWFYGLNDIQLSLATWIFYLRLIVIFCIAMKLCDSAGDMILLIRRKPRKSMDIVMDCTRRRKRAD